MARETGDFNVPGCRGTASGVGLATDVWVLVLVADIKAEVVDNITGVFYDVGTLSEVLGSSITAQVLKLGQIVRVGSGRETREDVLLGEEERTGTDGEDGSLASWIFLLELREVGDQTERLQLLVDDLLRVATDNYKDIKIFKAVVGLFVSDLRANDDTLLRERVGLGANDGDFESLGVYRRGKISIQKEG